MTLAKNQNLMRCGYMNFYQIVYGLIFTDEWSFHKLKACLGRGRKS